MPGLAQQLSTTNCQQEDDDDNYNKPGSVEDNHGITPLSTTSNTSDAAAVVVAVV